MVVPQPAHLTKGAFMRYRCICFLSCFTLLSACAAGPSFEPPEPRLPERWQGASATSTPGDVQLDAQWWKHFDDARLDALIEQARRNNLDLRAAALRVAEARLQRSIASGARWPAVSAQAGYRRQRESEHGVSTRLIHVIGAPENRDEIIDALAEPFDVYQAGFDASWELDLWGGVRRAVEAADATIEASNAQLHDADLTLIAEVARTYLELLGTRDLLRIARDDVAAGTAQLELTRFRVDGGLVTDLDLTAQQAEVANTRAQIPALEQREAQLRNTLALLLGADPNSMNEATAADAVLPSLPSFSTGVPSELARRRPDIREAEARLHAATAEIGVAVADLYPRVSLTGSFVHQSLEASDFSAWGARQWSIGPSISVPIFQAGRLRSVVELRKVQQQRAAIEYQRTVLNAWHEIENALSAYAAEQRRNDEIRQVLNASRDAYDIAHTRYEHGLTNHLIDLDAHRTWLQAQRAHSDSNTQLAVQLVALCKALGGGWQL
jgi:NodT family efflux transporter outer membrane factor (OMF) lipoprotein